MIRKSKWLKFADIIYIFANYLIKGNGKEEGIICVTGDHSLPAGI